MVSISSFQDQSGIPDRDQQQRGMEAKKGTTRLSIVRGYIPTQHEQQRDCQRSLSTSKTLDRRSPAKGLAESGSRKVKALVNLMSTTIS